jgi:hypothetical protein
VTILAPDQLVIRFTAKGERALDVFAITLVEQAELTPAGITDLLERLCTAPIAALADALLVAEQVAAGKTRISVPPATNRGRP